jgi:hypothetical protein
MLIVSGFLFLHCSALAPILAARNSFLLKYIRTFLQGDCVASCQFDINCRVVYVFDVGLEYVILLSFYIVVFQRLNCLSGTRFC